MADLYLFLTIQGSVLCLLIVGSQHWYQKQLPTALAECKKKNKSEAPYFKMIHQQNAIMCVSYSIKILQTR